MTVLLFPEQPPFSEILSLLGYTQEDITLYRHSIEHFIWGHVLRTHLDRLIPEEKKHLQDQVAATPDDPAIIPRYLARMESPAELRSSIESVSADTLRLSLEQLGHQLPADKPEYRRTFTELAGQLRPIRVHIGEWLEQEPLFQSIFTQDPIQYPALDRIRTMATTTLELVDQQCAALRFPPDLLPQQITGAISVQLSDLEHLLVEVR